MVKMDQDDAGFSTGSVSACAAQLGPVVRQPLDQSAAFAVVCQEVGGGGACTSDPLIEDLSLPGSDCLLLKRTDSAVSSRASK